MGRVSLNRTHTYTHSSKRRNNKTSINHYWLWQIYPLFTFVREPLSRDVNLRHALWPLHLNVHFYIVVRCFDMTKQKVEEIAFIMLQWVVKFLTAKSSQAEHSTSLQLMCRQWSTTKTESKITSHWVQNKSCIITHKNKCLNIIKIQ